MVVPSVFVVWRQIASLTMSAVSSIIEHTPTRTLEIAPFRSSGTTAAPTTFPGFSNTN